LYALIEYLGCLRSDVLTARKLGSCVHGENSGLVDSIDFRAAGTIAL